jgi:hypothetical protein
MIKLMYVGAMMLGAWFIVGMLLLIAELMQRMGLL